MAWKTMDIEEQRVRFVVAAARGTQGFSSLCAEFGISRPTGYLWQQRYQDLGIRGIAERSRKPHRSLRRTADNLEQRVVELRLRYHPPRWEYPSADWVLKVDCNGTLEIKKRKWRIGQALAGEYVQVVPASGRWMIFYSATLVRELDPQIQCWTVVERWIPDSTSVF
jgi:transposase